jgi:hypothetical protein
MSVEMKEKTVNAVSLNKILTKFALFRNAKAITRAQIKEFLADVLKYDNTLPLLSIQDVFIKEYGRGMPVYCVNAFYQLLGQDFDRITVSEYFKRKEIVNKIKAGKPSESFRELVQCKKNNLKPIGFGKNGDGKCIVRLNEHVIIPTTAKTVEIKQEYVFSNGDKPNDRIYKVLVSQQAVYNNKIKKFVVDGSMVVSEL